MSILEVRNIEKHFGATQVLKDISFTLEEGQAISIIGSSGSGKTTLLRTAALFRSGVRRSLMPTIPRLSRRARSGKSGYTSAWCSKTSISSPSTQLCRM